jgi:hypothetical protein
MKGRKDAMIDDITDELGLVTMLVPPAPLSLDHYRSFGVFDRLEHMTCLNEAALCQAK